MKGKLNSTQISYVLYHLNHHIRLTDTIRGYFAYDTVITADRPRIVFLLSESGLSEPKELDGVPVLFPLNGSDAWFHFDKQGNLIFQHDLLKSIFYLLSGYQELNPSCTDDLGRFPYEQSIQYKLGIADFPVVNFYFDVLREGIERFCGMHNISFGKRDIWETSRFGFLLTHDVDRVDKWTIHLIKLRIKQLLGMARAVTGRGRLFGLLMTALRKYFSRDNPYWSFDWLKKIEDKYGFVSTWFFLSRGVRHIDAYYGLDEERIVRLIRQLGENDEIGLHASYRTMTDAGMMKQELEGLQRITGKRLSGVRQHWLRFTYPETLRIQEGLGFTYDSSWMFAEHMGWRNSYCLPFRPYDIDQDRMMDIWEIPLCYMDNTPIKYQQLDVHQTRQAFQKLLEQIVKFRGILVLLWHNNYFDEEEIPGLRALYLELLEAVHRSEPESLLPSSLIERFQKLENG